MNEIPRNEEVFERLYHQHSDTVYRICFTYLKNANDAQDAVQETFYKFLSTKREFTSDEHVKAWLIVVASNYCKNLLKHWWRKREDIDNHMELSGNHSVEMNETLKAVLNLPVKYKTVVYLYYYEGYDSGEIASMLKKPKSTIRDQLRTARKLLKDLIGEA